MAKFVKSGDPIWTWTVHQFAGEGLGRRISWNGKPPNDEFFGQNSYSGKVREIRVLEILRGQHLPGEMQWSVAVFELHNIRGHARFDVFAREAFAGKLTRSEYIQKMTETEFNAMHQQRAFYKSVWVPHARRNHLSHTPYYWKIDEPDNYDEWIAQYAKNPHYPGVYGEFFDKNVTPFVKARSDEFTKAVAQVRAGRGFSNYEKLDRLAGSMESGSGLDSMGGNIAAPSGSIGTTWKGAGGMDWVESTGSSGLEAGSNWLDANTTTSPDTEKSRSNRYDDLLVLNKGIVEVQKSKEIESIEKQGQSLYLSGKFKEAAPLYEQAADIRLHDVGAAHPDYATALTNLALIYFQLKRYDDAERLYKQALTIRENADGEEDSVKITLRHLIALYHAQGKTFDVAVLQRRIKSIEDREELDATDYEEGKSTDKVEWMKAPLEN
jgi:Tetratricopeptide repeat.